MSCSSNSDRGAAADVTSRESSAEQTATTTQTHFSNNESTTCASAAGTLANCHNPGMRLPFLSDSSDYISIPVTESVLAVAFTLIISLIWRSRRSLSSSSAKSNKPQSQTSRARNGFVTLVGAGPGDPDLLTVSAVRAIKCADVVITDRLVSQGILDLIPSTTRIIVSKKYKGRAQAAQEELQLWMADEVKKGNHVARLKGGDPFMYGRGGEEIEAMQKLGVAVRVVPGLSSVLCAPLVAGISVTSRGVADRVVVLSGHCKAKDVAGAEERAVDSVVCCTPSGAPRGRTLAMSKLKIPAYDPSTTMVFLMAIATLQHVQDQLMNDGGFPESCPVAIIERASTPDQRVTRTTVGKLVEDATSRAVASPATVVVGRAVDALCPSHKFEGGAAYFGSELSEVE